MDHSLLQAVADGVVVSLDYVLTVDGQIVDSTTKREPLEYLHGYNNIIIGLEQALAGMAVGESKDVLVPAKEAYGEFDPNGFAQLERSQFPPDFPLQIGETLHVRDERGRVIRARICEIGVELVKIDLNHPLAGKDLSFWARVAAIRPATEAELSSGRVGGGCSGCSSSDCGSGSCH